MKNYERAAQKVLNDYGNEQMFRYEHLKDRIRCSIVSNDIKALTNTIECMLKTLVLSNNGQWMWHKIQKWLQNGLQPIHGFQNNRFNMQWRELRQIRDSIYTDKYSWFQKIGPKSLKCSQEFRLLSFSRREIQNGHEL